MNQLQAFLAPLFVHFALLNYLGVRVVLARIAAVRGGEVQIPRIATDSGKWPESVKKFANNFNNQFELPPYWYALTALVLATVRPDIVFIVLSWVFLGTRLCHFLIHTSRNNVPHRMYSYLAGFVFLSAMFVWLAIRTFVTG